MLNLVRKLFAKKKKLPEHLQALIDKAKKEESEATKKRIDFATSELYKIFGDEKGKKYFGPFISSEHGVLVAEVIGTDAKILYQNSTFIFQYKKCRKGVLKERAFFNEMTFNHIIETSFKK